MVGHVANYRWLPFLRRNVKIRTIHSWERARADSRQLEALAKRVLNSESPVLQRQTG